MRFLGGFLTRYIRTQSLTAARRLLSSGIMPPALLSSLNTHAQIFIQSKNDTQNHPLLFTILSRARAEYQDDTDEASVEGVPPAGSSSPVSSLCVLIRGFEPICLEGGLLNRCPVHVVETWPRRASKV